MKKIFALFIAMLFITGAGAYQKISSNQYGVGDARNENIVVRCTTPSGQIASDTCSLRRYAKCVNGKCSGWDKWRNIRNTRDTYSSWQDAANACCRAKGLR